MFHSQYYTCEQVDERLLQGYVDDFNEVNSTNYSKDELLLKLFQAINWDQVFGKYEENPEFVRVYLDANNKVLLGIRTNGDIYYGAGVPSQIKNYIDSKVSKLQLKVEDILIFLDDLIDSDKTLKELLLEKVDKEEGKSLIDAGYASTKSSLENPEFLKVEIDEQKNILEATRRDGTKQFFVPVKAKKVTMDSVDVSTVATFESLDSPEFISVVLDEDKKILSYVDRKGRHYFSDLKSETISALERLLSDTRSEVEAIEKIVDTKNKLMKITKSSGFISMRTSFSDTEDFIMRYRLELNGNFTWNSAYLGDKEATDAEILATPTIQSMGDSTGPLACHGYAFWAMWAQHGYCIPRVSASHSLTSDDIGSIWKDQRDREYSVGQISGNTLYLLPKIRPTQYPGVYTRDWLSPRTEDHPEITDLYWVSGGSHTSHITADSWDTFQIRPFMALSSRTFLADGKEIVDDGVYYCNDFVIAETFNCTDPCTVEQWFPTPIQREVGAVLTETFTMHGLSCRYDTILEMKKPYQFRWYGANQTMHFIPEEMPGYDVYGILPRAKKGDYDAPHIIDRGYSISRNSTDLRDVDKQVDRFISYFQNQDTDEVKIGCASGLSLTRGITKDSVRNEVYEEGNTVEMFSLTHTVGYTNKAYFKVLVGSAFENDIIPAGYIAQFSTYLCYFNPKDNKGQVYWYKDGNSYVVYAHYQDANTNLAINLPEEMEGLSVELVDKTDGVTLLTEIVSNGRVYVTTDSANNNYIVFKVK